MTPEEIKKQQDENLAKAKEAQDKINARIAELKTFEGKVFKRKDGLNPSQTIKVNSFAGIHKFGGQPSYSFLVESKFPQALYITPATAFLESHCLVEEKIENKPEII